VDGVDRDAFSVLEDAAAALERGDMGQLETLAGQVEALHTHVVNGRAEVGVQQQRWQSVLDRASSTAVLLNQVVSDEESVDYAATLVELSNLQTAYQASLNLTAQMLALPNLFEVK
jgi:flagellin-like hook-associated protein FlgL